MTIRELLSRLAARAALSVSGGYRILDDNDVGSADGWLSLEVAEIQHRVFRPLVESALRGRPRADLAAATAAIQATGLEEMSILEVGCGSGYHREVFERLVPARVRYVGTDYSFSMLLVGRQHDPLTRFVAGNGRELPFRERSIDVVFFGTSLMHIREWRRAISEGARVARAWCVFHVVPLVRRRATTRLRKFGYGQLVDETIFNDGELSTEIERLGLVVRQRLPAIEYNLQHVLGERTWTETFLCEKRS